MQVVKKERVVRNCREWHVVKGKLCIRYKKRKMQKVCKVCSGVGRTTNMLCFVMCARPYKPSEIKCNSMSVCPSPKNAKCQNPRNMLQQNQKPCCSQTPANAKNTNAKMHKNV